MAKVIYGIVAGALAALVAGFFVETTPLPLFVSVGLSCLAVVLIVLGWSRRLRRERELGLDVLEVEEIEASEELEAAEGEPPEEEIEVVEEPEPSEATTQVVSEATEVVTTRQRPDGRRGARDPQPARASSRRRVVVVPGRQRYHLPSCRFATAKDAERVNEGTAVKRGCDPCSVCKPDA